MKLLINTSNRLVGGGLQVAISVITETLKIKDDNEYYFACNKEIMSHFTPDESFFLISGENYKQKTKQLNLIENIIKPDVIFTVFGPAYWRPKAKHVIGYARGFYFMSNKELLNFMSIKDLLIMKIKKIIHTWYMNRDADMLIGETEYATRQFLKIHKYISIGKTVSNTYSSFFDITPHKNKHSNFILLTVSKYYKHKNFKIFNSVCENLLKLNIKDVKFWVTLNENDYNNLIRYKDMVINKGFIKAEECPQMYEQVDAMFLPTLAECFSASYPEAMKMEIPIITSNLPFARSICKDGAIYINPFDGEEIAKAIINLKNDNVLYNNLIEKGKKIVSSLPKADVRCKDYIKYCEQLISL